MPYGFPNLDINFNIAEAKDNAGDAGSTWCGSRWEAKANQLANIILWKWGLAKTAESKPLYYYQCANLANGLGLWNYALNYKGKGLPISPKLARETFNCELLEGLALSIEAEFQRAANRVNEAGMLGGSGAKNAKIDKLKWSIVRDFSNRAVVWQDGIINTCEENANIDAWEEILAAQEASNNSRPEGMSNGVLAAIIGGGSIAMVLVISKFVK